MAFTLDLSFMTDLREVESPMSRLMALEALLLQHADEIRRAESALDVGPRLSRAAVERTLRDLKQRRAKLTYIHAAAAHIPLDTQGLPVADAAHRLVKCAAATRAGLDRTCAAYRKALATAPANAEHDTAPTSALLLSCTNTLARTLENQIHLLDLILAGIDSPHPSTGAATVLVGQQVNRHNRETLDQTIRQLDEWERRSTSAAHRVFIETARQHCRDLQSVLDDQSAAFAKLLTIVGGAKTDTSTPIVLH